VQVVRQQPDNGLIGFAIRWRRRGANLQGTVTDASQFIVPGSRSDMHRQDEVISILSRAGLKL